jgi:hypothetical protein
MMSLHKAVKTGGAEMWNLCNDTWRSLIVPAHAFIVDTATQKVSLPLKCWESGVLCWPAVELDTGELLPDFKKDISSHVSTKKVTLQAGRSADCRTDHDMRSYRVCVRLLSQHRHAIDIALTGGPDDIAWPRRDRVNYILLLERYSSSCRWRWYRVNAPSAGHASLRFKWITSVMCVVTPNNYPNTPSIPTYSTHDPHMPFGGRGAEGWGAGGLGETAVEGGERAGLGAGGGRLFLLFRGPSSCPKAFFRGANNANGDVEGWIVPDFRHDAERSS